VRKKEVQMNNFKGYALALVAFSLLLGFSLRSLAQQPAPRTFTTIDFPGAADTVECCSAILNINPVGQIVGGYLDVSGTGHGFLLSHGNYTTIDFPEAIYTEALGINPEGQIVGTYVDASFDVHGFLLSQGNFSAISFPGSPMTFINWINPEGDMVGGYLGSDGTFHGLLVSRGTFTTIDFPGASATFALGINSGGKIVGAYVDQAGINLHGFLLSKGRFRSFDIPGSVTNLSACGGFGGGVAYTDGINNEGAIVGGYCGADGHLHGFLLSQGSALTIDFPGALYIFAGGINPEGEIVGGYQSADGHYHGFLLSNGGAGSENALIAPQGGNSEGQRAILPENVRKTLRRIRLQ
jgi:probable HAF family extracellular repeat protein